MCSVIIKKKEKIIMTKMTMSPISFGQALGSVEFKNAPSAFDPNHAKLAKKSTMTIDGTEIKYGGKFFILDSDGKFYKAKFQGVLDSITRFDEFGNKTMEVMYKIGKENIRKLSSYIQNSTQVFSEKGLIELSNQLKSIIK